MNGVRIMNEPRTARRLRAAARACAIVGALGSVATYARAETIEFDLPPGLACEFGLHIEIRNPQDTREFKDKNGNVVRILSAGRGAALSFTNAETGAQLSVRPNGSVTWQTSIDPDGTWRVASTGHNVVILFPSDVPEGPSTKQYVGRLVYTVDAAGVFRQQSFSGRTVDICAALSS
jgi:hypothetical protein